MQYLEVSFMNQDTQKQYDFTESLGSASPRAVSIALRNMAEAIMLDCRFKDIDEYAVIKDICVVGCIE